RGPTQQGHTALNCYDLGSGPGWAILTGPVKAIIDSAPAAPARPARRVPPALRGAVRLSAALGGPMPMHPISRARWADIGTPISLVIIGWSPYGIAFDGTAAVRVGSVQDRPRNSYISLNEVAS